MPAEMGSMIERCATDPTSRSLRDEIRRGTLVVPVSEPAEMGSMIERCATDPTSRSLRETDLTTRPLDLAEACFPVSVGIGLRVLREGGTLFAV